MRIFVYFCLFLFLSLLLFFATLLLLLPLLLLHVIFKVMSVYYLHSRECICCLRDTQQWCVIEYGRGYKCYNNIYSFLKRWEGVIVRCTTTFMNTRDMQGVLV